MRKLSMIIALIGILTLALGSVVFAGISSIDSDIIVINSDDCGGGDGGGDCGGGDGGGDMNSDDCGGGNGGGDCDGGDDDSGSM